MFKKIYSLAINFPRHNTRVSWLILGFVFALPVSAFGQITDAAVAPGDVLHISVWGDQPINANVTVGPDGTILLPLPIGSIYVNQMTASQITGLLTRELEEYVKEPVVSVSIRSFQGLVVHLLGQVKRPSFYRIPEGTSFQEALTLAGGFTDFSDPSSIILIRTKDGEVEKQEIDFSRFLKQNEMESNPILQMEDVVVVPSIDMDKRAGRLVSIVGEVARPGSYEMDRPMSLMDILALAGGILRSADVTKIFVFDRSREGKDAYSQIDMGALFYRKGDFPDDTPIIFPGQTIFVPNAALVKERTFSVNVTGQVARQGSYQLSEDMRLVDAIFKAGGFALEASIEDIAVIHADQKDSPVSTFSLKRYFVSGDMSANPSLQERDTIIVPTLETAKSISPVQMAFSSSIIVSLIGAVSRPGMHRMATGSDLLTALTLAGGPSGNSDLERTMIIRGEGSQNEQRLVIDLEEVVVEGKLELLPIMSNGDVVLIPRQREKRHLWRTFMNTARDIIVVFSLIYSIERFTR